MKKILLLIVLAFTVFTAFPQTDGMSYQAVIIDPEIKEIPGQNISGNILVNTSLAIRFTISNSSNFVEFQEEQSTSTDAYGMINLTIGQGHSVFGKFDDIDWDGSEKELLVEINIDGSYVELSKQSLLFVPYAFHRDIIATGDLKVEGSIDFSGDLEVNGITNLNNSLSVNNESQSHLTGNLTVDGKALFNNDLDVANESSTNLTGILNVNGTTTLNNALEVTNQSNTHLSGDLKVDGGILFGNDLTVDGFTTLNKDLLVNNGSTSNLTGALNVDGTTTLNNALEVTNQSNTHLSGDLKVDGGILFGNDLTVDGFTTLNKNLLVTNGSAANLTGELNVDGETNLNNLLTVTGSSNFQNSLFVDGPTTLNNTLKVANQSNTYLTGDLKVDGGIIFGDDLTVDGFTTLNKDLLVNNGSTSNLTGDLNVDGATNLNDSLTVTGASNFQNTLSVDGPTTLNNTLKVANQSNTYLTGDLKVDGGIIFGDDLTVDGFTTLNKDLLVNNGSTSNLTGDLNVDGATTLNNTLKVANQSNTHLTGDLKVDGGISVDGGFIIGDDLTVDGTTTLNDTLTVTNGSYTHLTGDLKVNGNGVFAKSLVINDTTFSRNLVVKDNVPDGGYLATFENTNDGNGDGIKIKLGKASANNNLGSFTADNLLSSDRIGRMKDLIDCSKSDIERAEALGLIVADGLLQDLTVIVGLAAGVGNMVTGFINHELGLPLRFPGITIPSIKIPKLTTPEIDLGIVTVPKLTVTHGITIYSGNTFLANHVIFPVIPQINLGPLSDMVKGIDLGNGIHVPSDFSLEIIDPTDLGWWGIPNISLIEEVNNPLNNENEFIRFSDSSDKKMGAVRAESVENWKNNYLFNPIFLYKVYGAITSSTVDKYHAKYHLKGKLVEAAADYYYLGVEYSSGNGDYAEWLERVDPDEVITFGDIVGVTGGKITKDLTNAEQVMAVSHHPIVLGNTPPEGETYLGNNIAFMGQIPVKIMGAVSTGDYIVAKGEIAGYGIAVSSENMTLEDFKLAVGRAWEDNADKGPKMVNTVIGVHNGDYLNILKRYEQKFQESESRLEAVEAKIDILTGLISEKHKIN